MSRSLTQRLQALADSYKQTLTLIQELQNFSGLQSDTNATPDERRVELGNEIHESLKEQEDTLELLRQEIEDDSLSSSNNRQRQSSSVYQSNRSGEQERYADILARLSEDIKTARAKFRRAQLQAKRNADTAKRKEREALFRRADNAEEQAVQPSRRPGQERLTQAELAQNASEDVTRALRRAHDLLQGNLTQSQFAQQTLDESQDALKSLGESYGGTGDLLKNSRSLVGQLVRSNKSDTWYLQTAFYMLAITIAWLVFRRLLYGPLWWFLWQPLKLMWWITMTSLGAVGFGKSGGELLQATPSVGKPVGQPVKSHMMQFRSMELPAKGGGWGDRNPPSSASNPESMVEKVGQMVDDSGQYGSTIDKEEYEQILTAEEQPRNTKKRMMEVEIESGGSKDEL